MQDLIGKPLAVVSDARLSSKSDGSVVVERLLSISGEDSLTVDRKYKTPWTGQLPTRLLILTNELPRLSDTSGALASRFVMFVLTKSFLGMENPALTSELLEEASGIFNWALEGLDRLNDRGYFKPSRASDEAMRQMEDLASPIRAFIRERCEVGAAKSVSSDDLWQAWKQWCEDDNRGPGNKSIFGRNLKAALPTVEKRRPRDAKDQRHSAYEGISLATNTVLGRGDHRDQQADQTSWSRWSQ
jgi:putative DNA primase/helicase